MVVLNWNGWRDTSACLASLQQLTYPDFRILVVDNGSTDDSVTRLRQGFPGLALLQSGTNLGFGGGCNVGIREALRTGADYVWLINSDARVAPDALSHLVELAQARTDVGAVGSVIFDMQDPGQVQAWGGGLVNLWLGQSHHRLTPGPVDFVSGASLLLRATALQDVAGFDERRFFMYWEDTDLGFRLRKAGWSLAVAPKSHVWHHQSASLGKESALLVEYNTRSAMRFLRLHAPVAWFSCAVMLMLRSGRALWRRDFGRLQALWRGALSA